MLPTPSARERAHAKIRDAIIRGTYAPGVRLSENELAAEYCVSRQPVREALLLLAQERLVEVRPRSGTYVCRIDMTEVAEAQFIREAIELSSLERSRELSPSDAQSLSEIVAEQRLATSLADFYPLDEKFHRALLDLSGHQNAWTIVTRSKSHLDRARYLGFESNRSLADYADDHENVLRALVRGERERAVDELRVHLRQVLADIKRIRVEQPQLFD